MRLLSLAAMSFVFSFSAVVLAASEFDSRIDAYLARMFPSLEFTSQTESAMSASATNPDTVDFNAVTREVCAIMKEYNKLLREENRRLAMILSESQIAATQNSQTMSSVVANPAITARVELLGAIKKGGDGPNDCFNERVSAALHGAALKIIEAAQVPALDVDVGRLIATLDTLLQTKQVAEVSVDLGRALKRPRTT